MGIHIIVDIEKCVEKALWLIRNGYRKMRVISTLEKIGCEGNESYELARCRIRAKGKFSQDRLYFDTYGLRYSTPEIIGRYRAKRIRGYSIADISCGVGMQAIFFSFTNEKILCVDINPKRVEYAKRNAKVYGVRNIEFFVGDCFSNGVYSKASKYDIIFSDPARDEAERERRLENLTPSPLKVIEKYGERDYIFDLPPQISQEKIPRDWEKEYISLKGKIKRLTAYTGTLYRRDRRAVALPQGAVLESDIPDEFILISEFSDYIYIVDESVYYARLLGELKRRYPSLGYITAGKRRTLATSSNLIDSPFLKPFKVLFFSEELDKIIDFLRREGYGKVTLRLSVPPKRYWEIRKEIEKRLSGNEKVSLFKIGNSYVIGKDVT